MIDELDRAIRLREEGKPEEARDILVRLVEDYPDDPSINYQCAWVHDLLGLEREAAPFYEAAIANGLAGEDLEEAMIGLGSTYRVLGEYGKAVERLREAVTRFPENHAARAFLAMALYNTGENREATALLLRSLAETSADRGVSAYKDAVLFYAERLDETWE